MMVGCPPGSKRPKAAAVLPWVRWGALIWRVGVESPNSGKRA